MTPDDGFTLGEDFAYDAMVFVDAIGDEEGFAAAVCDEDAPRVSVRWKGALPPAVEQMARAMQEWHGADAVTQADAAYSRAELSREAQRISSLQDPAAGYPHGLAVGPEDDASGLVVEVEPGSAPTGESPDELRRRFGTHLPVRVVVEEGTSSPPDGWWDMS